MKPLRVAIVGCGNRAQSHAKATLQSQVMDVVWACDIIPERAETSAEKWGAKPTLDYREVLADPSVEAILNVTSVEAHLPIALDALAAGKHMILEKPVGDNVELARELVRREEETGLVVYVSFQLRFFPDYRRLHDLAEQIKVRQIFFERQRGMLTERFLKADPYHGIYDVVAHDFDQVLWYMGRPPVAVTAVVGRNTFTEDTGVADIISALVDFGDGHSAMLFSSVGATPVGTRYDLIGSQGNVSLNSGQPEKGELFAPYSLRPGQNVSQPLPAPEPAALSGDAALQAAFVREIRTGERSQAARTRDGLNALLVSLASDESGRTGQRIALV
ncbi:MAG: Gfo/Idh/MocA family oxidoreductase [Lentisphaeria bacterium]|jgi:predicted dehydrogenase|nr:Gfo/Idh/MocA family oxidoreductase [Lentisphaeria bacterium]